MSGLPNGWTDISLGDGVLPIETVVPANEFSNEFDYIDIGAIDNKLLEITLPKRVLVSNAPSRARRKIRTGDVLFSTVRTYLKNIASVPLALNGSITSTGIAVLRSNGILDPRYIFHFVTQNEFARKISLHQDGSLYPAISDDDLLQSTLPTAPLPEQRRIVAKIDRLSARSKRARDELGRVPVLVARLKRSILRSAFEGHLTRDFRAKENDLLGWLRVRLQDVSEIQTGVALGKKHGEDSRMVRRPYLRVANVQRGWLNLDEIKEVEVTEQEAERLTLRRGDILMNEGGDRDKLGRGWVWQGQIPGCIHQNHVFRVRLNDANYPPELLSLFTNEFGQEHFLNEGKQTTNLASISKAKISTLPLLLPPHREAIEILRRINNAFAAIDRLVTEAKSARALVDRLDQAILAKAFRGELVPQDPNDEPASVLLDRIRAERAASGPAPRRGRRPRAAAGA